MMTDKDIIDICAIQAFNKRQKLNLTLRDVEVGTGISKSTLCAIEKGKRESRLTTYIRLLHFYKQKERELYGK